MGVPVGWANRDNGLIIGQFEGRQVRHDDEDTVVDVVRSLLVPLVTLLLKYLEYVDIGICIL